MVAVSNDVYRLRLEGRLSKLMTKPVINAKLIKKLQRQLRNLEK